MPSTSGRAATFPRRVDKLKFFIELKELRDKLKREREGEVAIVRTGQTSGETSPTSGGAGPTSSGAGQTSGETGPTSGGAGPTSGETGPTSGGAGPTSGETWSDWI